MSEDAPFSVQTEPLPSEPSSYADFLNAYRQSPAAHPYLLDHARRLADEEANRDDTFVQGEELEPLPLPPLDSLDYSENDDTWPPTPQEELSVDELFGFAAKLRVQLDGASPEDAQAVLKQAVEDSPVKRIAAQGNCTSEQLDSFVGEMVLAAVVSPEVYDYLPMLLKQMPINKLRNAYFADPSQPGMQWVKAAVEQLSQDRGAQPIPYEPEAEPARLETWRLMSKLHGLPDALSLITDRGAYHNDPNVRRLLARSNCVWEILDADLPTQNPEGTVAADAPMYIQLWGDRYLEHIPKMPQRIRSDLLFAASSRTTHENGDVDIATFRRMLMVATANAAKLGGPTTELLRDKAGIINLDYYNVQQLKRMADVVSGDQKTIQHLQHLQAGDVTVVFTDGKGDHNGALMIASEIYETPSGRTLFFEVSKRSDFKVYRDMLAQLGIKPSTVVFAGHGNPYTGTGYGSAAERFRLSVDSDVYDELDLETFMQDSRGEDDNPDAVGRRRIIYHSCSQGVRTRFITTRRTDGRVVHRTGGPKQSNAAGVARGLASPKLDVYAARAVMRATKTDHGLEMLQPNPAAPDDTEQDIHLDVSRFSVDSRGTLYETWLNTLVLRKGGPAEEVHATIKEWSQRQRPSRGSHRQRPRFKSVRVTQVKS